MSSLVQDIPPELSQPLSERILAMADDELILAHRNSEWTGHAPILEEDIAFSNIAQDELGHAVLWYELFGALRGQDPDSMVFFRSGDDFRNVRLVELPNGDWAFSMLRQYLFDALELARLESLLNSEFRPVMEIAAKIKPEEIYHYRHSSSWIRRLGMGTEESNRRTQSALNELWPFADQFFFSEPGDQGLSEAGILPDPSELRLSWEGIVGPFLTDSGLVVPPDDGKVNDGREVHTEHLEELLLEMQEVANLDPEAKW